jgi:hypothetical protein
MSDDAQTPVTPEPTPAPEADAPEQEAPKPAAAKPPARKPAAKKAPEPPADEPAPALEPAEDPLKGARGVRRRPQTHRPKTWLDLRVQPCNDQNVRSYKYADFLRGYLHVKSWGGMTSTLVRIVSGSDKTVEIEALTRTRLGGRNRWLAPGERARVPRTAVRLSPVATGEAELASRPRVGAA